jgi:23S rRNA (adenine2503-C2)-methyltransferase
MPVNRRWPLADLKQALYEWPRYAGNKLCIEYVLIPGVNDAPEHLDQVAEFMSIFRKENGKTNAILNLIPYNPRRNSPWPAPEESHVAWFLAGLIERGVFAKRRRTKGRDMMGACGQLGAAHIRQRKLVQPTISA